MNLAAQLEPDFTANTRKRGHNYYQQGRVRIVHGGADRVEAEVQGSYQTYGVEVEWEDNKLSVWCDCPAFDSGPCKHHLGHFAGVRCPRLHVGCGFQPRPEARVRHRHFG